MRIFYLISTLIISALTSFIVGLEYLPEQELGSTITTINASDLIKDSRAVINTNLANLNTDKLERSDWFATTSAPQITSLANLATVGTITSGTWNGTTLTVARGGTGSTTLLTNAVLVGNGTGAIRNIGYGSSGEFLTSQGDGNLPYWSSASVNQTLNYNWSGQHTFSNGVGFTGTTTFSATSTFTNDVFGAGFTHIAVYTASTTWVKPTGVTKVRIRLVGGGGTGGSNSGVDGSTGGGGGGGYCEKIADVTATTSVQLIVGGIGGTSSFGNFCSATGGSNGGGSAAGGNGGAGGIGSLGDLNLAGQGGMSGIKDVGSSPSYRISGAGGGSLLGGGGAGIFSAQSETDTNGNPGGNYGGGGSGCIEANAGACTGGAGAQGVVIIEY